MPSARQSLIIFAYPVMPESMERMAKAIGLELERAKLSDAYDVDEVIKLSKPDVPFTKVDDEVIEKLQKIMEKRFRGEEPEQKEEISIEDFQKLDIRIGRVLKAEKVKNSKKLIKLIIDIGGEERQIVSGIAEDYTPEELEGKLVVVLVNLKPAKFMGVESKGMILAAEKDGRAVLLTPEKEVEPGTRVC